MALKDIKNKINATRRTRKVTRAMEAVSAVKMRKTQGSALADRPYARAASHILRRLVGSTDLRRHPLCAVRPVRTSALVLITSDKGLAGALNASVLKIVSERVTLPTVVFAYGRKGEEYMRRRGYDIVRSYENKNDDVPLSVMEELSAELARGFAAGSYDEVVVAYSNFKSTFEQVPTVRTLLPLSAESFTQITNDILPEKGKYSTLPPISSPSAYTFEPSAEAVLGALIPRLVAVSLYHMLLEAKASEHSSRMVAMKNASDKSEEVAKDLTRRFNKIRQAAITREVSEIVGGREALAV